MKKIYFIAALLLMLNGNSSFAQTVDWAENIGISTSFPGMGLACDDSGNVYSTGCFHGTVDFDPGSGVYNLTTSSGPDLYIQKLDRAGNLVWAKSVGMASGASSGIVSGFDIKIDNLGNVVVCGDFTGTVDFDPGSGTFNMAAAGDRDGFILKLDALGNLLWAKQFGGRATDRVAAFSFDNSGNIVSTGSFLDTVDFDPGSGVNNLIAYADNDIFVLKLDAAGNFIWVKQMGGLGSDWGLAIYTDDVGSIYSTGSFTNVADFDPGAGIFNFTTASTRPEIFVSKLDAAGNFIWAKQMGSLGGREQATSIIVDAAHNVYTTGWYVGANSDFDPDTSTFVLSSAGSAADIFISRLDSSGNFSWAKKYWRQHRL